MKNVLIGILVVMGLTTNSACKKDKETFVSNDILHENTIAVVLTNQANKATVVKFETTSGTFYSGSLVKSTGQVKNTGSQSTTYWLQYSVQDLVGDWTDSESVSVVVKAGQTSPLKSFSWKVPGQFTSGKFNSKLSVWDSNPVSKTAKLITSWINNEAFDAYHFIDNFDSFNNSFWDKSDYITPGIDKFYSKNITVSNGKLILTCPKNTRQGAELFSKSNKFYKYGSYKARFKCATLKGGMTTFWLYENVDVNEDHDEIDFEIYSDTRRVDPMTYKKGKKFSKSLTVKFDPTTDFHVYEIIYLPTKITWKIDNSIVYTTTNTKSIGNGWMRISASIWFKDSKSISTSNQSAQFDYIQH